MDNIDKAKLVKDFCEDEFERFQEWLDEHDIEPTEAEYILNLLEADNGNTQTGS